MNISTLINKYRLNKTEQTILLFLQENLSETKDLGIRGVAKQCFTSPATIVNLAKKMNYSGYTELVFKIKEGMGQNDSPENSQVSVTDYPAYQERFSVLLSRYSQANIMILASGFSQIISNYVNESLIIHGFRSISNSHLELLEPDFLKETLVLTISESGETTSLKEIILRAQGNGIDVISFTGNPQSTIAKASSLAIQIKTANQFSSEQHAPHLFYGNTLNMFELLLSAYLRTMP